jgi:hypothetical protein
MNAWGPKWCPHLEEAYQTESNSDLLWTLSETGNDGLIVQVPIFPTKDLFAAVTITDPMNKYRPMRLVSLGKPGCLEHLFVCYLNEGEGFKAIRGTLIEMALAKSKQLCSATHHTSVPQRNWDRDMLDNADRVAQFWSVWYTNWCITCNKIFEQSKIFLDPDVVPPKPKTRWNPHA